MTSKSTDFSRWWGVGAKAPLNIYSTNEVGGYKNQERDKRVLFRDQRIRKINPEATDEVGGDSLGC